jgi:hypothetical protein
VTFYARPPSRLQCEECAHLIEIDWANDTWIHIDSGEEECDEEEVA